MKKNLTIGLLLIFSVTLIFSLAYAKDSRYAWLGIATQTVNEDIAEAFDLEVNYGAIVNEIFKDSPADKAGLLEGDVIISYNSEKVYDYDDLVDYLEDSSPDESISLTIMRDNDKMNFDVTLGKTAKRSSRNMLRSNNSWSVPSMPGMPPMPSIPNQPNLSPLSDMNYDFSFESSSYIGVHLTDLTDQLREHFGVRADKGVLVSEVEADSPAEKAGIQAGDIIIESDGNDVSDYSDLKKSIKDKEEGDIVSITLIRDKNKKQFDITVAENEDQTRMFFNAPDISFNIPNGKHNMTFFSDGLHEFFDTDEFKEEIKELKKELENLKFELKNEMFEEFNSKEFKQEMKKLKKELKENESQTNKELKAELQKLKIEFKELEKRIDD